MKDKKGQLRIKALSINEAYTGRRYMTKECRKYKRDVGLMLPAGDIGKEQKIQLDIKWGFTNANIRDVDNPAKLFIDVLQGKYNFNDAQVWRLVMEKELSEEPFIHFNLQKFNKNIL